MFEKLYYFSDSLNVIFIISSVILATFYGIYIDDIMKKSETEEDKKNKKEAVKKLTERGLIQFATFNAIRHIVFSGNITGNQSPSSKFFEWEAGGAQLGIAAVSLINVLK